jgi:hypothetical protein
MNETSNEIPGRRDLLKRLFIEIEIFRRISEFRVKCRPTRRRSVDSENALKSSVAPDLVQLGLDQTLLASSIGRCDFGSGRNLFVVSFLVRRVVVVFIVKTPTGLESSEKFVEGGTPLDGVRRSVGRAEDV